MVFHEIESTQYDKEYFEAAELLKEKKFAEVNAIYEGMIGNEEDTAAQYAYLGLASNYVLTGDLPKAIENYQFTKSVNSRNIVLILSGNCLT